ncbi:MAG: DJ-1/PfpI family protein [Pseudomonadales bacterium]|nr:DJ-1/PfpI family protein [Pseudomonadales bacterium]
MNVGIYIYDNAEVLDFSGPFEVFSTASRVCKNNQPFNVCLIAETLDVVTARAGYRVLPDFEISNHPNLDVLIIPGGVHTHEMNKQNILDWIYRESARVSLIASVCTGAFLLAQAHVLTNQQVTTHWEDIPDLKTQFPKLDVISQMRWVDQGNLVTSGGISAGIDMSLHLISKLHSIELAEATAMQMEFSWTKNA